MTAQEDGLAPVYKSRSSHSLTTCRNAESVASLTDRSSWSDEKTYVCHCGWTIRLVSGSAHEPYVSDESDEHPTDLLAGRQNGFVDDSDVFSVTTRCQQGNQNFRPPMGT